MLSLRTGFEPTTSFNIGQVFFFFSLNYEETDGEQVSVRFETHTAWSVFI